MLIGIIDRIDRECPGKPAPACISSQSLAHTFCTCQAHSCAYTATEFRDWQNLLQPCVLVCVSRMSCWRRTQWSGQWRTPSLAMPQRRRLRSRQGRTRRQPPLQRSLQSRRQQLRRHPAASPLWTSAERVGRCFCTLCWFFLAVRSVCYKDMNARDCGK